MVRPSLLHLAPAALLLSLTACDFLTPKVSAEKLEAELIKWLGDQGLTATEAKCPDNQKLEKGNRMECTCMVDGVEIPVSVEVTDPTDGTVQWQPKYTTVKKEQLEQSIRSLPQLVGHDLTIDCHKAVFVSVPESAVECDLTDNSTSELWTVKLKFSDGEGSYGLEVVPKQG